MIRSLLRGRPRGRLLCSCAVLCVLALPGRAGAQSIAPDTVFSAPRLASLRATMPQRVPGPTRQATVESQLVDLSGARPLFGESSSTEALVVAAPEGLAQQPVTAPLTMPRNVRIPSSTGSTTLLRGLYVSFAALQMLDAASTVNALNHGAVEANPLMKGVASTPAALIAVKAATAASTIFVAERIAKKSRWGAIATMIALNSVYAMVVSHNYGVASAMAR